MNKNLALFRNKNFTCFFFAALLGVLGEGIYGLTAIVIVLERTESIVGIGKMLVLTLLPSMVLAPFLGVFIDRFNKMKLAIICNLLRFLTIVLIPVSYGLGFTHVSIFFFSIFLSYIIWYILEPLKEGILKEILKSDEYKQGISLVQGAWQLGLLSSAIIAGVLIDHLGTNEAIVAASTVYILAGILFMVITTNREKQNENSTTFSQYKADFRNGWAYIFKNKKVLYFTLTTSMVLPFFYAINTLIAPFNYQVLNGDGISLGIIDSGAGIGSLISAIICTLLLKNQSILRVIMASIILTALFTYLFSLSQNVSSAFGIYMMMGIFIGIVKVLTRLLLFEYVEEEFIGRVMTSVSFVSLALSMIMALFISFLAEQSLTYGYIFISIVLSLPLFLSWMGSRAARQQEAELVLNSIQSK